MENISNFTTHTKIFSEISLSCFAIDRGASATEQRYFSLGFLRVLGESQGCDRNENTDMDIKGLHICLAISRFEKTLGGCRASAGASSGNKAIIAQYAVTEAPKKNASTPECCPPHYEESGIFKMPVTVEAEF